MGELKDIMLAFLAIDDQATWRKGQANGLDYYDDYVKAQQALAMRYMERMASMMRVYSSEKCNDHLCDAVYQQVEKTHEAIWQSLCHKAGGKDADVTATFQREKGGLVEQFNKK